MDLRELQRVVNEFVEDQGWYSAESAHPQTPRNLAVSLVLEASEVLEHFQWGEEARDKKALASELADVLHYVLQLAGLLDVDLETAVLDKLQENRRRQW